MFGQIGRLRLRFERDRLERKVGRVDLAVRVRIAHADDLPLVFEYQHVAHPRLGAELAVLRLQRLQEPEDVGFRQLGECEIVSRRVADDA